MFCFPVSLYFNTQSCCSFNTFTKGYLSTGFITFLEFSLSRLFYTSRSTFTAAFFISTNKTNKSEAFFFPSLSALVFAIRLTGRIGLGGGHLSLGMLGQESGMTGMFGGEKPRVWTQTHQPPWHWTHHQLTFSAAEIFCRGNKTYSIVNKTSEMLGGVVLDGFNGWSDKKHLNSNKFLSNNWGRWEVCF